MELFNEAEALHTRIKTLSRERKRDPRKEFKRHMTNGNIANASRQLQEGEDGGVLDLSDKIGDNTVLQVLKEKHLSPGEVKRQFIESLPENVLPFHPSIFGNLDDDAKITSSHSDQGKSWSLRIRSESLEQNVDRNGAKF